MTQFSFAVSLILEKDEENVNAERGSIHLL